MTVPPPLAFKVVPVKLKFVPRVISSITPDNDVPLPNNLFVAIKVETLGVVPPLDVKIELAVTLVTVPLPLLLKVVQSAELKAPLLDADAVGTFKVITGVVVPVAIVELKSVPVVPNVKAHII